MVYTIIFIYLLFCIIRYEIQNKVIGKRFSYIFLYIILVSMSTLRYRMGGDGLFYDDYYEDMPTLSDSVRFFFEQNEYGYQPFWIALVAACKSITDSIILFQFVHAAIFNTFLFLFINQYSKKPFTVIMLLYVTLLYFYYSFEIQRESLAVITFLVNIINLEEKKWVRYYSLAFLSILFHISAVVLLFLPLFTFIKLNKKLIFIMLIASGIILFFRDELLSFFNLFLFIDSMTNKAQVYSGFTFSLLGFISYYIVRVILFIPIGLFLASDESKSLKHKWLFSSFFIISILSQYFVGFERFLNYILPLYFILLVDFLYNKYSTINSIVKKYIVLITLFLHIFFILDYKLFITDNYGNHYYSIFFPYNSIFDAQLNGEREDFHEN